MKNKRWSEKSTEVLAAATREFDDADYNPPAQKPTGREAAALRRVRGKATKDRFRVAIALDEDLVKKADAYAATHGTTFSGVVAYALRQLIQKKSA